MIYVYMLHLYIEKVDEEDSYKYLELIPVSAPYSSIEKAQLAAEKSEYWGSEKLEWGRLIGDLYAVTNSVEDWPYTFEIECLKIDEDFQV